MRDVSPSQNTTTDKMLHRSNNTKRLDQGRPFSESSDAIKRSASASSDILRRGLQDKPQGDLQNKDLNQDAKTSSENEQGEKRPRARNGKLRKDPPEQKRSTARSGFREKARKIFDRWETPKIRDLPQNVDNPSVHPLESKPERASGIEPQTIMREHNELLNELKNTLQGVFDEYEQGEMTLREWRAATSENPKEVQQWDRERKQKLNDGGKEAMDRYYGERDTITPPGTDAAQEADRQLATFLPANLHRYSNIAIAIRLEKLTTEVNKRIDGPVHNSNEEKKPPAESMQDVEKPLGFSDGQNMRPEGASKPEPQTNMRDAKLENGIQGVSSQPNTEHTKQIISKEGRENKAIESASWGKANADAIKWKTEEYPDADQVGAWSILKNFPTIKIAAQLEKEYNKLAMYRMVLLKLPSEFREIFNRELSSEMLKLKKEYRSLEKTFPKNPEEVMTRWNNIDREIESKAQTIVDEWQTRDLLGANQVNQTMVINNFNRVIREATGLEKANTDVISVRQRLQELKEQFPKSPSEVLEREKVRTSAFGG